MKIEQKVIENKKAFSKVYEKMVYVALHINDNMSIKELSDICICSENTVRQAIKKLEALELVRVERTMKLDGSHLPNRYVLLKVPNTF